MKKLLIAAAFLSISLTSVSALAEESKSGWFIGASLGSASGSDIDEIKRAGASVGNSFKVMYGYRANEYVALEQAWTNFGTVSYGMFDEKVKTTGVTTELVVSLPGSDVLKPFVKVGVARWFLDSDNFSDSGTDLMYGAGITVEHGKVGLTLEHQIIDGAGMTSLGVKYYF